MSNVWAIPVCLGIKVTRRFSSFLMHVTRQEFSNKTLISFFIIGVGNKTKDPFVAGSRYLFSFLPVLL